MRAGHSTGDRTADGHQHHSLIDLQAQCESKCWIIGHLKLTEEECEFYKGIPVVYDDELVSRYATRPHYPPPPPSPPSNLFPPPQGFFFEPREDGIMKLCNEFPGFTRNLSTQPFGASSQQTISVPRSHGVHPADTMPEESYDDIRKLMKRLLPGLVGREIIDGKICWCTGEAMMRKGGVRGVLTVPGGKIHLTRTG